MIVAMAPHSTEKQIVAVIARLQELDFDVHRSTGATRTVIGAMGDTSNVDLRDFEVMKGVAEVVRITVPYRLASREFMEEDTVISIGDVKIGAECLCVMAGPCSVESADQITAIAERVAKSGAKLLRGGVFEPRTSSVGFLGLGEKGLEILRRAGDEFGLKVITEAGDRSQIDLVSQYADVILLGAHAMHDRAFLSDLGRATKPVVIRRGPAATYEEWLMAAEHVMSGGNADVVLCERGIRTFETHTHNTMDIGAIPVIGRLSHLPVIADPSQGIGRRENVAPMARAAVAAGADGLIVDVHHDPDHAVSGGAQSLRPDQFDVLMSQLRQIAPVLGRAI